MEPDTILKSDSRSSECSISLNTQNTLDLGSQKRKILEKTENNMEVDEEDIGNTNDRVLADVVEEPFSVLRFLRKVLVEELGNDSGLNYKVIVVAVHAVLLESGFVGFDPTANLAIDGFQFRDEAWPSLFKLSLFYTLPEMLSGVQGDTSHSIVLNFQAIGRFINVYGSICDGGSGKTTVHLVRLNEDHLVPFVNENVIGVLGTLAEKEVFKFWRIVKDNLALPLLIDISEKAGFDLPPCFMRLPSDLKLKILEKVTGADLAKVSCVSSELQHLASSDDLWKLKVAKEFGKGVNELQGSWKGAFKMEFCLHHIWIHYLDQLLA